MVCFLAFFGEGEKLLGPVCPNAPALQPNKAINLQVHPRRPRGKKPGHPPYIFTKQKDGNTTLIVGTDDDKVEKAIEVIGEYSRRRTEVVPSTASYDIGRYASFPVEVQVGGATIFVVDVEKFVKL